MQRRPLPPARTQPLRPEEFAALPLHATGRARLDAALGGAAVLGLWKTRTRVDTGLWFRQAPLWAACTPAELILFAEGPRPFVERAPFRQLVDSAYNVVTAAVVLAPAESLSCRELRLPPLEGVQLLAQFGR